MSTSEMFVTQDSVVIRTFTFLTSYRSPGERMQGFGARQMCDEREGKGGIGDRVSKTVSVTKRCARVRSEQIHSKKTPGILPV